MAIKADSFIKRLLTFPFIQAVLDVKWHTPLQTVQGIGQVKTLAQADIFQNVINSEALAQADAYAQKHESSGLLIMHQGELIFERYYKGFEAWHTFNSMSMIKTVLSLLIGIAIDEGHIGSMDDLASDYLPEWKNDRRNKITIRHLLTMQSGLHSDVALSKTFLDIIPLYLGDDIEKVALSIPAVAEPGRTFLYNNVNSQLLGIILERATKSVFSVYLSQKLWQPLKCADANVWVDDKGLARTFAALFAQPQDWLKIASVIENRGEYAGERIVSATWIDAMRQGADKDKRYGLHMWTSAHTFPNCRGIPKPEYYVATEPFDDADTVFIEGMRMQCLTLVPSKNLVVFRLGERPLKDFDNATLVNIITRGMQ